MGTRCNDTPPPAPQIPDEHWCRNVSCYTPVTFLLVVILRAQTAPELVSNGTVMMAPVSLGTVPAQQKVSMLDVVCKHGIARIYWLFKHTPLLQVLSYLAGQQNHLAKL